MLPAPLTVLASSGFAGYQLLDSGHGRKLERFGNILVDRPEAQALWQPRLVKTDWAEAHAVFSASGEDDEKGRWRVDKPVPDSWPVRIDLPRPGGTPIHATALCRLAGLWHLGLFPEQLPHWQWMVDQLQRPFPLRGAGAEQDGLSTPRVLNLFGYTGAASLLAAAAGAQVTHVDASKKAIAWARDNQAASGLGSAPIRWIVDDAAKFVAREVRRGRTYDLILVDPPKFGRGPDGEVWDLFRDLAGLLANCAQLLAPGRAHLVQTVYAIRASALAFGQLTAEALGGRPGTIETGELAIMETALDLATPAVGLPPRLRGRAEEGGTPDAIVTSSPPTPSLPRKGGVGPTGQGSEQNGRILPTSLFVRWSGA